jgi:hypothetical protein
VYKKIEERQQINKKYDLITKIHENCSAKFQWCLKEIFGIVPTKKKQNQKELNREKNFKDYSKRINYYLNRSNVNKVKIEKILIKNLK